MESESKQLFMMTGDELVSMIETMIERKLKEHLAAGAGNISPDYARNFICDFILGKSQTLSQLTLFE